MNNKNIIINQLMNIFDKNNIECKFDDYLYVDEMISFDFYVGFEHIDKITLFKEDFDNLDCLEIELLDLKRIYNLQFILLFLPEIVTYKSNMLNLLRECLVGVSYLIIVYPELDIINE